MGNAVRLFLNLHGKYNIKKEKMMTENTEQNDKRVGLITKGIKTIKQKIIWKNFKRIDCWILPIILTILIVMIGILPDEFPVKFSVIDKNGKNLKSVKDGKFKLLNNGLLGIKESGNKYKIYKVENIETKVTSPTSITPLSIYSTKLTEFKINSSNIENEFDSVVNFGKEMIIVGNFENQNEIQSYEEISSIFKNKLVSIVILGIIILYNFIIYGFTKLMYSKKEIKEELDKEIEEKSQSSKFNKDEYCKENSLYYFNGEDEKFIPIMLTIILGFCGAVFGKIITDFNIIVVIFIFLILVISTIVLKMNQDKIKKMYYNYLLEK